MSGESRGRPGGSPCATFNSPCALVKAPVPSFHGPCASLKALCTLQKPFCTGRKYPYTPQGSIKEAKTVRGGTKVLKGGTRGLSGELQEQKRGAQGTTKEGAETWGGAMTFCNMTTPAERSQRQPTKTWSCVVVHGRATLCIVKDQLEEPM